MINLGSMKVVREGEHKGMRVFYRPRYMSDDTPWIGDNFNRFKTTDLIDVTEEEK